MLEFVLDSAIDSGLLAYTGGDLVVEPVSLLAGAVLTHRLSEAERAGGYIHADADLFSPEEGVTLTGPGGLALQASFRPGTGTVWTGIGGLLAELPAGSVLSVRYGEASAMVEPLSAPPALEQSTVAALRAAYDAAAQDDPMPATTQDLAIAMLAKDRKAFSVPQVPLSELTEAAGLERRGSEVAHDPEIWARAEERSREDRVTERLEGPAEAAAAMKALEVFRSRDWREAGTLREAMAAMKSPEVAEVVADELLDAHPYTGGEIFAAYTHAGPAARPERAADSEPAAEVASFAGRLLAVARKPAEVAVARWLLARAAERSGDPLRAEAQLRLAVEATDAWAPAADRLAWYLSDRGDVRGAIDIWRSLGRDSAAGELKAFEAFGPALPAKLGRNEPCWCGSGRKYKLCHIGQPRLPPLAARIGWLRGKSVWYLEHHQAQAIVDVAKLAAARNGGDTSAKAMRKALGDAFVMDFLLVEGGWFERFLAERGPLLPADEAELAASWVPVRRSVYEVVSVQPGLALRLKDLRSGEEVEVEVEEKVLSEEASPGMLVCARVVPDGASRQLTSGMFSVPLGKQAALLELIDEGDPEKLAAWVGEQDRTGPLERAAEVQGAPA